jgi:hypothetical protein
VARAKSRHGWLFRPWYGGRSGARRLVRDREVHDGPRRIRRRPNKPAPAVARTEEAGEGEKPRDGRLISRERSHSRGWQAVERSRSRIRRRTSGRRSATVEGRKPRPATRARDHGEAEAQEGQVGHWLLNVAQWRGPTHAWTEALKANNGVTPDDPRKRRSRLLAPPPRKGDARPAGGKPGGHAGGDELPGLRARNEPLKGEPQERHLPENGRTAEGGRSRREVEKTCGRHRSWQDGSCRQIPG